MKIKRIDTTLPLPGYQTPGAVGFDLYVRETIIVPPHELKLIPVNNIIEVPKGCVLLLFSRSSTPIKKGLMMANGVGVIDQDFCGDADELQIEAFNFTDKEVMVERGERIAQGMIVRVVQEVFEEVDHMSEPSRGGFGTTGGES